MSQAVSTSTTRFLPPAEYQGTPKSWRVLCEAIWPGAKSAESIMLALNYCAARRLDPFKRPVHIVPVWSGGREVETVWPGINELLTTATRSGSFAGVDEPHYGPDETRTFQGVRDKKTVEITVTFPDYCSVTVWRHVRGQRVRFSQPVYWTEAYARSPFKSELPNSMWEKRPRGQLHKCALAAALRLAFPEDLGSDYAAEEMEGREISAGGVTIDHEPADKSSAPTHNQGAPTHKPPSGQASGQRAPDSGQTPPPPPPGEATGAPDPLDEPNGTLWVKALYARLEAIDDLDVLVELRQDSRVIATIERAPQMIKAQIEAAFLAAHKRVAPDPDPADGGDSADDWPDDPIRELLGDIYVMNLITLANLPTDAQWRAKTRDLFPPDQDRLEEAIAARKALLKRSQA